MAANPNRLKKLGEKEFIEKWGISRKEYTTNFSFLWRETVDGMRTGQYKREDIELCLSLIDPLIIMNSQERRLLKNLPETTAVYRGNTDDLSASQIKNSWCWTNSPYFAYRMAAHHANGKKNTKKVLLKAFVKKDHVHVLWNLTKQRIDASQGAMKRLKKTGLTELVVPHSYEFILDPAGIFGESFINPTKEELIGSEVLAVTEKQISIIQTSKIKDSIKQKLFASLT